MPLGPTPSYLVKYNNYTLPGYAQSESFDSPLNIASHYGAYIDGSNSEDIGLSNKNITIRLKVWEQDYLSCKEQVQLAATMLRSSRNGFRPLYVQFPDRHYLGMPKSITMQKEVGSSVRLLEYEAQFECKPWLIGETEHTLTGTGTVDTDQVTRSISNGGWTPATITVTGTNVTVSGYNATDFAGYFSTTGAVSNLIVDSEAFTATEAGVNANNKMLTTDYRLQIGPGKTTFVITGASSCSIKYYDRWYI